MIDCRIIRAAELESARGRMVHENVLATLEIDGCGALGAVELGIAAGDNPGRIRFEASFTMLRWASPVEVFSGMTSRHGHNRGGSSRANRAL